MYVLREKYNKLFLNYLCCSFLSGALPQGCSTNMSQWLLTSGVWYPFPVWKLTDLVLEASSLCFKAKLSSSNASLSAACF